jgi:hypothetical protein
MANATSEALTSCMSGAPRQRGRELQRSPSGLGIAVAIAWLLFVAAAYTVAMHAPGWERPRDESGYFNWTVLVNATLLGLVAAGHASLKRGVAEDMLELRPILPVRGSGLDALVHSIANLSSSGRLSATLIGLAGGLATATLDPTLRGLYPDLSPFDPRYVVFLTQNLLFGALASRLFAAEVHMTRAYARLGERVEVDLLDPSTLLVFGRKGLRSARVWGSISMVFSMFWLLDSAGQANVALAVAVLGLATAAVVAPTHGVRRSIAAAKSAELAVVTEAIRRERDRALSSRDAEAPLLDGRLGSLIQYQALVGSVREWPFDLSLVSRSSIFIALGAGSWLGGALVEVLLEQLLH